MRLGQNSERRVVSHRESGLHAVFRHGKDLVLDILIGVSEDLVETVPDLLGMNGDLPVGNSKGVQVQKVPVQPLAVRTSARVVGLALLIGDDPLLLCIHQQNASRLKAGFLYDALRRDIQNAHLRRQNQTVVIRDVIP